MPWFSSMRIGGGRKGSLYVPWFELMGPGKWEGRTHACHSLA